MKQGQCLIPLQSFESVTSASAPVPGQRLQTGPRVSSQTCEPAGAETPLTENMKMKLALVEAPPIIN